jgi:hypothetical protein
MGNHAPDDQKQLPSAFQRTVSCIIYSATARYLREPPGADPHAGWCGGRGLKSPGYPIMPCYSLVPNALGNDESPK